MNGPRIRIDDISAPSGKCVARVSAAVTTVDRRAGVGAILPAADADFSSVFAGPSEGGTGSAEAPLPRRLLPSMLLPRRALHREPISPGLLIRPRSPLRRLATRRIRLPYRLRVASPLGHADEQSHPLALRRLLFIMVSGPTRPLVHPPGVLTPRSEPHGRGYLWSPLSPLLLPPRLSRRYSFPPAATAPIL